VLETSVTTHVLSRPTTACRVLGSLSILLDSVLTEDFFDFMLCGELSADDGSRLGDVDSIIVFWCCAEESNGVLRSFATATTVFFGLTLDKSRFGAK
jgi:hypothetical protein